HETNINIIARRTGKDVNSHTVLDGIITTIMATIQRINIIGSREGIGRSAASLRQNCVTVFSFSKNHFSSPSGRWSIVLLISSWGSTLRSEERRVGKGAGSGEAGAHRQNGTRLEEGR